MFSMGGMVEEAMRETEDREVEAHGSRMWKIREPFSGSKFFFFPFFLKTI